MELCLGFSDTDWVLLRPKLIGGDAEAWEKAIGVLQARIEERFLSCIEVLIAADHALKQTPDGQEEGSNRRDSASPAVPGFAIMALCCLLVETLQSFIEGEFVGVDSSKCGFPDSDCIKFAPSTSGAFKRFFRRTAFKADFNKESAFRFSQDVRNALLHAAETRGGWIVWRSIPRGRIIQPIENGYILNRTNFYRALKMEFQSYLNELRDVGQTKLRENFIAKLDDICQLKPEMQ
jgi:hypothetical protein